MHLFSMTGSLILFTEFYPALASTAPIVVFSQGGSSHHKVYIFYLAHIALNRWVFNFTRLVVQQLILSDLFLWLRPDFEGFRVSALSDIEGICTYWRMYNISLE